MADKYKLRLHITAIADKLHAQIIRNKYMPFLHIATNKYVDITRNKYKCIQYIFIYLYVRQLMSENISKYKKVQCETYACIKKSTHKLISKPINSKD